VIITLLLSDGVLPSSHLLSLWFFPSLSCKRLLCRWVSSCIHRIRPVIRRWVIILYLLLLFNSYFGIDYYTKTFAIIVWYLYNQKGKFLQGKSVVLWIVLNEYYIRLPISRLVNWEPYLLKISCYLILTWICIIRLKNGVRRIIL
jgi:hypothetical protein